MSQFFFGLLVAALAFMVVRRVRWRRYAYRGSYRGGRVRNMVRWLARRLDATEAQEEVMREAMGEVFSAFMTARGTWKDGLEDLASAMKQEEWDTEQVGQTCAQQEATVEKLRDAVISAFGKIHATLEPWQRRELARYLERVQGRGYARGC